MNLAQMHQALTSPPLKPAATVAPPLTLAHLSAWFDGTTVCPPCLVGEPAELAEWSRDCLGAIVGAKPIPDPKEYAPTTPSYTWRMVASGTCIYVNAEGADVGHVYEVGMAWCGDPWGRERNHFNTRDEAKAHVERMLRT